MTRRRRIWLGLGIVIALIVFAPILWQFSLRIPGKADFFVHHAEYENIVRTVKAQVTLPGALEKSQTIGGYVVWKRRSDDGPYTITIRTADWGHLGYGGYVYADMPPARVTKDPYRTFDNPGDLPFLDRRLDMHWWTVYNNLY